MTNDEKRAIILINEAAYLLGNWQICFDTESENVNYIILAKPDVINKVMDKLEE